MRTEDFHKLLEDPKHVADYLVDDLRDLARKYPYSQLIQLMYGLRLRTSSEHLFNQQLGKTAVLTNDRSVLFELFENRKPTLNSGVETVEVESVSSPPVLAQITEAPVAEQEVVEEPKPQVEEISVSEDISEEELPIVESSPEENVEPQAEKPAEVPPPPRKDLPSALPENLSELSPQERVKAILERNRQVREQFESQKSGAEAKLFEQDKPSAPEPEPKEELKEDPAQAEATDETEVADTGTEEAVAVTESEIPVNQEEEGSVEMQEDLPEPVSEPEEEAEDLVSAEEDSAEQAKEPELDSSLSFEEEEREPWADSPIDIEALIRRRFARRFESIEETEEEEVDWDEEEELESASTESQEDSLESEEEIEAQTSVDSENTEEEDSEASIPTDLSPEEAKSDLALASRIRMIRDRLETLRNSDALSREELEVLMEEHRQLEALMADLPLNEEQLFEVEIKLPKAEDEVQAETELSEPEEASQVEEEADLKPDSELEEAEVEVKTEDPESDTVTSAEEIKVPVAEEPTEGEEEPEEDLDSEIRRIEQLAEKMRSGAKDEGDSDSLSELREQRMNELIEERKKSLEAALTAKEQEQEAKAEEPEEAKSLEVEESKNLAAEETAVAEEQVEETESESGPKAEDLSTEQEINQQAESVQSEEEEAKSIEEISEPEKSTPSHAKEPSFSQWLKRIAKGETPMEPTEPKSERKQEAEDPEPKEEISKKIDLLDSFVEKLPELKKQSRDAGPTSPKPAKVEVTEDKGEDHGGGLVTETLAKVYIRQKHYKKAIQAYEILMLKYPEKSSFFASQISEIKKLANSK